MVRPTGINGVMIQYPSQPGFSYQVSAFASMANIINRVVTGINSIGCLPIVSSTSCFVMPPTSVVRVHYEMMGGVCPSVSLSVVCLDQSGERKDLGSPGTYLKVKRSNVKVTRPINAVIDNAPYTGQEHLNFLKISLLYNPLIMRLGYSASVSVTFIVTKITII